VLGVSFPCKCIGIYVGSFFVRLIRNREVKMNEIPVL